MSILKQITQNKYKEIALKKRILSTKHLELSPLFDRETCSLVRSLKKKNATGIIAEHKRRSPSKSIINQSLSVSEVIDSYQRASVSGISVLTDTRYFGGCAEDMLLARSCTDLPLLRKDFILEEYQIVEAKSIGADVILLIAALLPQKTIHQLAAFAKSLGLEVLLEVHGLRELQDSLTNAVDMIGVNNRDLKTFEVNVKTSHSLVSHIPKEFVSISESGINQASIIRELKTLGYRGFLIGEYFMRGKNIETNTRRFVEDI